MHYDRTQPHLSHVHHKALKTLLLAVWTAGCEWSLAHLGCVQRLAQQLNLTLSQIHTYLVYVRAHPPRAQAARATVK